MRHAWLSHDILAYDYKKKFGLETTNGIMSEKSKIIARKRNLENYENIIVNNLLIRGKATRFKQGHKGRPNVIISEQTRRKLSKRFIHMNKNKLTA